VILLAQRGEDGVVCMAKLACMIFSDNSSSSFEVLSKLANLQCNWMCYL